MGSTRIGFSFLDKVVLYFRSNRMDAAEKHESSMT